MADSFDTLARKHQALAAAVNGDALEAAATAGMLLIVNQAKANVHKLSGNLSRSLHTQTTEKGDTSVVVEGGTDAEYGATEELGNAYRPAHPYLRPAFDEKKGAALQETAAALHELNKKAVS